MPFKVIRHSFYSSESDTLRYSEYSPARRNCTHQICNCVTNVWKKPEGIPNHVEQYLEYKGKYAGYELLFKLYEKELCLSFFWGKTRKDDGTKWKQPHASFIFNRQGGMVNHPGAKNNLDIHIPLREYSCLGDGKNYKNFNEYLDNNLNLNVFFGNDVDVSHFRNGHSPSALVKLGQIKPDQVWIHSCYSGHEEIVILPDSRESRRWFKAHKDALKILDISNSYNKLQNVNVIREQVNKNRELLELIRRMKLWLIGIKDNIDKTEIFKLGNELVRKAYKIGEEKYLRKFGEYVEK